MKMDNHLQPKEIYKTKKYKKLISPYKAGIGFEPSECTVAMKHHEFLTLCVLLKELLEESGLWRKYALHSKIYANRIKFFVHENIFKGIKIIHRERVLQFINDATSLQTFILVVPKRKKQAPRLKKTRTEAPIQENHVSEPAEKEGPLTDTAIFEPPRVSLIEVPTVADIDDPNVVAVMLETREPAVVDKEHHDRVMPDVIEEMGMESLVDRLMRTFEEQTLPRQTVEIVEPLATRPPKEDLEKIITYEEYEQTLRKESVSKELQTRHATRRIANKFNVIEEASRIPVQRERFLVVEDISDDEEQKEISVQVDVHPPPRELIHQIPSSLSDTQLTSSKAVLLADEITQTIRTSPDESSRPAPPVDLRVPAIVVSEVEPSQQVFAAFKAENDVTTDIRRLSEPHAESRVAQVKAVENQQAVAYSVSKDSMTAKRRLHDDVIQREIDEIPPATQSFGVALLQDEEARQSALPLLGDVIRIERVETPPRKKRKKNPKYRFRFAVETLKRRYNRTETSTKEGPVHREDQIDAVQWNTTDKVKMLYHRIHLGRSRGLTRITKVLGTRSEVYVSPVEIIDYLQGDRKLMDVSNMMYSYDDYVVELPDLVKFGERGHEDLVEEMIYNESPILPEVGISSWTFPGEHVADIEIESLPVCDEREIIDIVRRARESAAIRGEFCQFVIDDILKSHESGRTFLELGKKSSVMSALGFMLCDELGVPYKQPAIDHHLNIDAPVARISDLHPQDDLERMTEIIGQRARCTAHEVSNTQKTPPIIEDQVQQIATELPVTRVEVSVVEDIPLNERVMSDTIVTAPQGKASVTADRRDTARTQPPVDVPEALRHEDETGVFIGQQEISIIIPTTIQSEGGLKTPVVQPVQRAEIEDDEEPLPPRRFHLSKNELLRKVELLLDERIAPINFSVLCSCKSTPRYVAAQTFHRLLLLHADKKIQLDVDADQTYPNTILIYPRVECV